MLKIKPNIVHFVLHGPYDILNLWFDYMVNTVPPADFLEFFLKKIFLAIFMLLEIEHTANIYKFGLIAVNICLKPTNL